MKIVVLDGCTLNPGDLSWEPLQLLGETRIYDRSSAAEVIERARDAELVLANKLALPGDLIRALKRLRYIGVTATGFDIVDMEAARASGITVTNVPVYGTASVAQFVFALLLELCHRVQVHNDAVRAGDWSASPNWCFWKTPLVELAGKTIGIVGMGRIGGRVAEIAKAFGMCVVAHDVNPSANTAVDEWCGLERLLRESDVVTLHCPLFPETRGIIDRERLALMKPGALLINTSRGSLVIAEDLAAALNNGQIAGAAVDVLAQEPPPANHPLLAARNCIVTPHIAWATREARGRLLQGAIENVAAFLGGAPRNVVS